jgi:hypothetical protein
MKKLNDYILEQEINESENWFIRLFKAAGRAMKTNIKNKFADKYPNWYKEYETLEKVTNIEEAKKKIDTLLAAVDDMSDYKDDTARAVAKLATLYTKKVDAEEAKNKELVKLIDSKIKEMREANPEAQKQVEKEMKQSEKENGGNGNEGGEGSESGEEPVNPGANAVGQNPEKIKKVIDILGFKDDLKRVIGKMKTMMNESVNESLAVFESNKTGQQRRKIIKTLYNDPKTTQEMNIALTTLFLAYETIKGYAKKGGGTVNQDTMRALFDRYDNVEPAPADEIKNDVKTAAEQK